MLNIMKSKIYLFAIAFLLGSCSVKENRQPCPCRIQIDLSTCSKYVDRVELKGWHEEHSVLSNSIPKNRFGDTMILDVPRGRLLYCALGGVKKSSLKDWTLSIPEGEDADRIYAYGSSVNTDVEEAYDMVRLHKEYCRLSLKVGEYNPENPHQPDVCVRGIWNGLLLDSMEPQQGSFRHVPERREDGLWELILPRQGDDSLILEISLHGEVLELYELGRKIESSGYDWRAEDLDDLFVEVELGVSNLTVEIIPWKSGSDYEEII